MWAKSDDLALAQQLRNVVQLTLGLASVSIKIITAKQ